MEGCEHCGGWPIIICQRCHPEAATYAVLHRSGLLEIKCEECDKDIVAFNTALEEETAVH